MKKNKHMKKIFSMILIMVLIMGTFPGNILKAHAEGESSNLTETLTANQLLNIDGQKPEAFDENDNTNPYGATEDNDGTLAIPWNELVVLTECYDENIHEQKWYTKDSDNAKDKALEGFESVSSTSVGYENLSYVQSVAFDKEGNGRKAVVAYIGVNPDTDKYVLWTVDTSDGNKVASTEVTYIDYATIFSKKEKEICDHFAAGSLFSITAGDFGRGHDTIVVATTYIEGNGTVTVAFEFELKNGNLEYLGATVLDATSTSDYYNTVSLETGDINGDDEDELVAVLSKTNGAPYENGKSIMKVYYGKSKDTSCIVSRESKNTEFFDEFSENDTHYRVSFAAPGVAIGDVDGNGTDEIVIGGYRLVSKDLRACEAEYLQLLAIYNHNKDGSISLMKLQYMGTTEFTYGK